MLEQLKNEYKTNKNRETLRQIQQINSKKGITISDAEYLQEYVIIITDFIGGSCSLEQAFDALEELNEKYETEICSASYKSTILGSKFARDRYNDDEGESWCPSAIC